MKTQPHFLMLKDTTTSSATEPMITHILGILMDRLSHRVTDLYQLLLVHLHVQHDVAHSWNLNLHACEQQMWE